MVFRRQCFSLIMFLPFLSLSPPSEDWAEELSSGEESLSSSLGSDAEGPYFPVHFRNFARKQLPA